MAITQLTTYGVDAASGTLSTAQLLASVTGAAGSHSKTNLIGNNVTGYGELYSQGNAGAWAAAGSIGSPSGRGYLWDVTTLEGNHLYSGNWFPVVRLNTSTGSITADIYVRFYKWHSGPTYTLIGTASLTAQSIALALTVYTLPATPLPDMSFSTGDKLYIDNWLNVTADTVGNAALTVAVNISSGTTLGRANNAQTQTPGYGPALVLSSSALSMRHRTIGRIQ